MADLSQVVPALAAGLGVGLPGAREVGPELECPDIQHAFVCLIDGLGEALLDAHGPDAPFLASGRRAAIDTVFPTTTPAALASFGMGQLPGAHGLVGASFLLPETGRVLAPLSWGEDPSPLAVQPEPTMFERLADAGVDVRTVSAAAYAQSGLTRSVLRGSTYLPAESIDDRLRALAAMDWGPGPSFTYVYWPDLDRTGHEHGCGSPQWRARLRDADRLVRGIVERMPPRAALIVTADHGMVNCPEQDRILLDTEPSLLADVELIAGEPRARHVYVRAGAAADVARRWAERLGGVASVYTREQLVDSGLLGVVEEFAAERVGDVVAVCDGTASLASSVDPRVSSLLGQHGALTLEELRVPAIRFQTTT